MADYELIGSLGTGSAIAELAFARAGVAVRLTDVPYLEAGPPRSRLLSLNPLGQVPVLVTPAGPVLTESAAIVLHLNDIAPHAALAPAALSRERLDFLNLLFVLAGAVYPTFTYGDFPERYTEPGVAAERLHAATSARREALWRTIDAGLGTGPFALGEHCSALDLYFCVMRHWEPGPAWFERETPRLMRSVAATSRLAGLGEVLARHFPAP